MINKMQVYGNGRSKSARELARYLGIPRLRNTDSRYRPRTDHVILNWGKVSPLPNVTYVNPIEAVNTACNKLSTLRTLDANGVSIPCYYTDLHDQQDVLYVARTDLYGCGGSGIVIGYPETLPDAPLYTEFIEKDAEYRVIVVDGKVADYKRKLKRRPLSEENPDGFDGEHNPHVWNLSGGYVFARGGVELPEHVMLESLKAINALGLRFGAVDVITKGETPYVLEVNTAFGIEGSTLEKVGNAFLNMEI